MRKTLTSAALFFVLTLFVSFGAYASSIGERFVGERFVYTLGFWIFDDVATAEIELTKEGPYYVATFKARTKGFIDAIRHREDHYRAIMEEIDGGKRFRTIRFEKVVKVGRKSKKSVTTLDYERGVLMWEKWRKGKKVKEGTLPIPEGVFYDCPLTGFYNFRYGAYGPIREGASYSIKTLPKEDGKEVEIRMQVLTDKEKVKRRLKRKKNPLPEEYYLTDALIPKRLFDSKSGKVEILFDRELTPLFAVARDVLLFGDVRGELIKPNIDKKEEQALLEKPQK